MRYTLLLVFICVFLLFTHINERMIDKKKTPIEDVELPIYIQ
jgi:hypothetical protein